MATFLMGLALKFGGGPCYLRFCLPANSQYIGQVI